VSGGYHKRVRRIWVVALLVLAMAGRAQTLCEGNEYQRGLCAYRAGAFAHAEQLFRKVVEAEATEPETIKAHYFLARSLMKQRKWQPASQQLIRIYGLSRSFYNEWNCDFLLGECRKALGLG
jgi:TolA-binding protein